ARMARGRGLGARAAGDRNRLSRRVAVRLVLGRRGGGRAVGMDLAGSTRRPALRTAGGGRGACVDDRAYGQRTYFGGAHRIGHGRACRGRTGGGRAGGGGGGGGFPSPRASERARTVVRASRGRA